MLAWTVKESARRLCPIELQQGEQVEAIPGHAADEGEKPGEAVLPCAQKGLEAQEQVQEQGGPDLPAHGVGAMAEEIAELEGLLDLIECAGYSKKPTRTQFCAPKP